MKRLMKMKKTRTMKMRNRRLIEALDKDDLRVLGIGIDLVIPNDTDGQRVMSQIQRILNRELKGVARVA